jgi:RimJ/RimL family protein N-acetyltransferase
VELDSDRIDAGEQELGFRLRRVSWGQGLATAGASALVEHGFVRVGTEKISARTLAANRAHGR